MQQYLSQQETKVDDDKWEDGEMLSPNASDMSDPKPLPLSITKQESPTIEGILEAIKKQNTLPVKEDLEILEENNEMFTEENFIFDQTSTQITLEKRAFAMRNLVSKERDYVQDLSQVVEGYMAVMIDPKSKDCHLSTPKDLEVNSTQYSFIYKNIDKIYKWHKDEFLPALEECLDQPQELQAAFEKLNSVIHLYETYLYRNSISAYLMDKHAIYFEEVQQFLGHDLQIFSLLNKPTKQINKYNLLLKDILRYTEQGELNDENKSIKNAIEITSKLLLQLNDRLVIDRIYNFKGNINDQGKLLLHGTLRCTNKPFNSKYKKMKYSERYVFLFEKIMIITKETYKYKLLTPFYYYIDHIWLNKMELDEQCNLGDGSFIIKYTNSNWKLKNYVCCPTSFLMRFKWFKEIQCVYNANCEITKTLMNP